MGVSFALSEKTTLAFQVTGFYQPNMKVAGLNVRNRFRNSMWGASLSPSVF